MTVRGGAPRNDSAGRVLFGMTVRGGAPRNDSAGRVLFGMTVRELALLIVIPIPRRASPTVIPNGLPLCHSEPQ